MSFEPALREALEARKAATRYRDRVTVSSPQQVLLEVKGRQLLNFCSNDYLGLANHPDIKRAAQRAIDECGFGGAASHLVCGHHHAHHVLEEALADFTGRDRVLLFSTGYMANIGVLQALLGRKDTVFEDKLNHASLLDGATLSRAKLQRYRHLDTQQLDQQLSQSTASRKMIVTDGVFSMDGDCAPLSALATISERHNAMLMVDDAHGFGCLGKTGAGLQEQLGLTQDRLPILVGTLGKAFGSFGAFVAGSDTLIETLIQFSRSYIYTTSMPPSVAAASTKALRLIISEEWRREKLRSLIQLFKELCAQEGIELMPSDTAIQPVVVGDERHALHLSQLLNDAGFWVTAIRPPTVPENSSRLRIIITAAHEREQVEALVEALSSASKRVHLPA